MGDDANAPNPDAGAQKLFDLVGLAPAGKYVKPVNDLWKAFDHGEDLFKKGDPKAIADVVGDAGAGLGAALHNAPRILETVGRFMERAGAKSGIGALEQFGKQVFSKGGSRIVRQLAAAETYIIEDALMALTVMGLMLGFGDPDSGGRFGDGSSKFQEICDLLETAFPKDWEGAGSRAYTKQNTRQQDHAETMAHADNMVHGIVQNEARQLKETQDTIDIASDFLMACVPAAIALYFIPEVGPPMSLAFQVGAVAGAMPVPTARMAQMAFQAMQNAGQVQQAIGKYNEVASTARPTGAPSAFCPPPGTPGSPGAPGTSGTPNGPGKSGTPSGPRKPGSPSGPGSASPSGPSKPSSPTGPGTSGPPSGSSKPSSPGGQSGAPSTSGPNAPSTPKSPNAPSAPSMPSQPSTPSTPVSPGTPSTRNVPWVTTTPSGGATPVATAFSGQAGRSGPASTTPPVQPVTPGAGPGPSVPKPPGPQTVPGAGPDTSKLPPMGRAPVSHEIEAETDQVEERAT